MYCPSSDSLFLRANGRFVCWDDAGSDTLMGDSSDPVGFLGSLLKSADHDRVVKRLGQDKMPRPETCCGCYCLSPFGSPASDPSLINIIQVEPSARCTLRCPACATEEERSRVLPPLDLAPSVFHHMLEELSAAGIEVRSFDFSGHGEPLMNPELPKLLRICRQYNPKSFITLCTNGQGECSDELVTSGADLIQVAVDGVDQACYETYRRGGDFRMAMDFMTSLTGQRSGKRPAVEWRYILFNHNDAAEQISEACELAFEAGVDSLKFIFTHRGPWSKTLTGPSQLRKLLRSAGIPGSSIRVREHGAVSRIRTGIARYGRRPGLFRLALNARTALRRLRPGRAHPVVAADYCRSEAETLSEFIRIGLKHAALGEEEDAARLLDHVEKLAAAPAAGNPEYSADQVLERLGAPYFELRGLARGR